MFGEAPGSVVPVQETMITPIIKQVSLVINMCNNFFRARQSRVDTEMTEHTTGRCTTLAARDDNKLNNVVRIVHQQVTFT